MYAAGFYGHFRPTLPGLALFFLYVLLLYGGIANANAHSLTPLDALTFNLVQAKLAARNVAAQAAAAFA